MKERLIGAAVLVALGVWLIPWVLDGPAETQTIEEQALELPIPPESTPLRSQTITLNDDREQPVVAGRASETAIESEPPAQLPNSDEAPVSSPEAAPSLPPADTTAEPGWFVQVGSYAEVENARRQADRVSSYGYDARVSTFSASGRSMQRVRVGPEASRERAETVASSLSAHGFVVQVVAED